MSLIPGIKGRQYARDGNSDEYKTHNYQYATTSHMEEQRMYPKLIVYPEDTGDIQMAVAYAKKNKIAVAIRTGGHQYSGASSTDGSNILLDLSQSFTSKDDLSFFEVDKKPVVRASVSWDLLAFNKFLGERNLFIPHGQCSHVHLGGHVQTGGYGQLGRSFGLLGDHVVKLEVVDSDGALKTVTKSDKDLFFAILGGSPGNFCVITHITLNVYRDSDYKGSCGFKALYWYKPETLKNLLDILVDMANSKHFPRNYDYCVSMLSSQNKFLDFFPEMDGYMREHHPQLYGKDSNPFWPKLIIVYAQWVPFFGTEHYDKDWFDKIANAGQTVFTPKVTIKNMSELTKDWIFMNVREFDLPYIKRTYLTTSTSLVEDKWTDWVTKRIDNIAAPMFNGCYLSVQIQNFGGEYSQFYQKRDNGTSYSWRDSSIVCVLDCFYNSINAQATAAQWQQTNDSEGIGKTGKFSKDDRRVLWGSYGSFDLDENSEYYYESGKYDRLCDIKKEVDPNGVFTPNTFCVGKRKDAERTARKRTKKDPEVPEVIPENDIALAKQLKVIRKEREDNLFYT